MAVDPIATVTYSFPTATNPLANHQGGYPKPVTTLIIWLCAALVGLPATPQPLARPTPMPPTTSMLKLHAQTSRYPINGFTYVVLVIIESIHFMLELQLNLTSVVKTFYLDLLIISYYSLKLYCLYIYTNTFEGYLPHVRLVHWQWSWLPVRVRIFYRE